MSESSYFCRHCSLFRIIFYGISKVNFSLFILTCKHTWSYRVHQTEIRFALTTDQFLMQILYTTFERSQNLVTKIKK